MTTTADHIQLVWDRGCACTVQAESGCSISVGPAGEWTPERLLTAAVESSVMTNFLRLADGAGLEVLGYVSAGEATFEPGGAGRIRIVVRPCVSVRDQTDVEAARRFLEAARASSPIVRVLGDTTTLEAEVVALGSREEG
jgi:hypothetical protein